KRLRPLLAAAAFRAVDPGGDRSRTFALGAALEILQSYLLIHDDWMDRDEERRGGPSVYGVLKKGASSVHTGECLTVLAGDLASAYAFELFLRVDPGPRPAELHRTYHRMLREVIFGQHLDVLGSPDVDRVYHLKTGSYTTRGPALLGALLAGATDAQLSSIDDWATPLGIAFQLRDELLGTFGDRDSTGKPIGSDLRAGKRTKLVEIARSRLSPGDRSELDGVLGRGDAPDEDIERMTQLIVGTGARMEVEALLRSATERSSLALTASSLDTADLAHLTQLLVDRNH
ncbi:MAG: polyprenyl synthetase family protein, partial [Myxococcales bacterium]|nr:polyprenyl synthetase family protein [Myxococcales bacterium]